MVKLLETLSKRLQKLKSDLIESSRIVSFYPPEIIRKHMIFRLFQGEGEEKLIRLHLLIEAKFGDDL